MHACVIDSVYHMQNCGTVAVSSQSSISSLPDCQLQEYVVIMFNVYESNNRNGTKFAEAIVQYLKGSIRIRLGMNCRILLQTIYD